MENGKVSLTPQKWRHPLAFNRVYRSQPAAYIMLLRLFRRRRRHFQSWLMRGASPCPRWAAHHTSALLRPCKLINRAETAANWRCWPIKALGWPDEWPHLWQVWTHWRWLNFFKKWPFLKNDLWHMFFEEFCRTPKRVIFDILESHAFQNYSTLEI